MTEPSIAATLRDIATSHADLSEHYRKLASTLEDPTRPLTRPAQRAEPLPPPDDDLDTPAASTAWQSSHFPMDSLRWHAERALAEAGHPLTLDGWADRVRAQGFVHKWNPKNPRQLEASLSALPHQTPVFVKAGRRMYDLAEERGADA